MTKKRMSKRAKLPKRNKPRVPRGISPPVKDYMSLVVDPCNAPLCKPLYPEAGGSMVTRSTDVVYSDLANTLFLYHPYFGLYRASSATYTAAMSDNAVTGAYLRSSPKSPGIDSPGRAVAGCVSVSWALTESARKGTVYCGIIDGNAAGLLVCDFNGGGIGAGTYTAQQIVNILPNAERMPVDKCEVNWVPGERDHEFKASPFNTSPENVLKPIVGGTNWIAVVCIGADAAAIQCRITNVVEWNPTVDLASGLGNYASDPAHVPRVTTSYTSVLRALQDKDSRWYINTFKKAAKFIGGAASGYATGGLPGLLGYLVSDVDTSVKTSFQNYG